MKRKSLPTGRDFLFVEGYGNENPGAFQSPRPLRGATNPIRWRGFGIDEFQSTRPLRGATALHARQQGTAVPISIHAPLAGRDLVIGLLHKIRKISIHAPLAGRDGKMRRDKITTKRFQSTRPLRGAT